MRTRMRYHMGGVCVCSLRDVKTYAKSVFRFSVISYIYRYDRPYLMIHLGQRQATAAVLHARETPVHRSVEPATAQTPGWPTVFRLASKSKNTQPPPHVIHLPSKSKTARAEQRDRSRQSRKKKVPFKYRCERNSGNYSSR